MDLKNADKKQLQKENAKKGNQKCTRHANAKTQCKTNINQKSYAVSSKMQIAENAFGHPLDSHLGGVQDMQSRLPGFHAFRFLNLLHMRYVQE